MIYIKCFITSFSPRPPKEKLTVTSTNMSPSCGQNCHHVPIPQLTCCTKHLRMTSRELLPLHAVSVHCVTQPFPRGMSLITSSRAFAAAKNSLLLKAKCALACLMRYLKSGGILGIFLLCAPRMSTGDM